MSFTLTPAPASRVAFTRSSGAAAQHAGNTLEEWINFSACLPGARKTVTLEHLPRLGAKFVGKGKFVKARICIDFIGMLHGNPAAGLFFDAKSCGPTVSGFDANRWHADTPHQAGFLRRMRRAGAVAGILVRAEKIARFLWADVSDVDVLGTVPFARDGVLAKEWLDVGAMGEAINFGAIAREYKIRP